MKLGQNSRVDV